MSYCKICQSDWGYAVQGNSNNLSSIFNDISKKVNATTISGNVTIDLNKYNGDVIVDPTSNFVGKNGVVQIPFNITFPIGKNQIQDFIRNIAVAIYKFRIL